MFYSLLFIQVITLFYHQITTRFDFYPFNGVRHYSVKERRVEALVNGIVMVIAIILSITQIPALIAISGVIWTLIMFGAILNWWLPYFTGREFFRVSKDETWFQIYERIFSKTIHILPRIKNNPRPNLEHVILHLLILCASVLSWLIAIFY